MATLFAEPERSRHLAGGIDLAIRATPSAPARWSTSWQGWRWPRVWRVMLPRTHSGTGWRLNWCDAECVSRRCRQSLDMLPPPPHAFTSISRPWKWLMSIRMHLAPTVLPAAPARTDVCERWLGSRCSPWSCSAVAHLAWRRMRVAMRRVTRACRTSWHQIRPHERPSGISRQPRHPVPLAGPGSTGRTGDYVRVPLGWHAGWQLRECAGRRRHGLCRCKGVGRERGPDRQRGRDRCLGNDLARPSVTIDPGAADQWLALPIGAGGNVPPGEYGVYV